MKHILAEPNLELLAQFAWSRVLVAFDFDGTLAPIVTDHASAAMRLRTRRLLTRVCKAFACAVISGRSRRDVEARLADVPVKYVIGNHGIEPGIGLDTFETECAQILPLLRASLSDLAGIEFEDKRFSLAVHYRRARARRSARDAIARAVASLPFGVRTIPGKLVVNVLPENASTKGDALLHLRSLEQADTALYVGDDGTDEDVFELDQPGRLLGIRVGKSSSSAAPFYVRDQREVDALLRQLAEYGERVGGA